MALAPFTRTRSAGARSAWPRACGRCYMPRRCCEVLPAARVMPWTPKMTADGWPLAGKAHIGDDHSLAYSGSWRACRQPGMSSGPKAALNSVQAALLTAGCRAIRPWHTPWRRRALITERHPVLVRSACPSV